MRSVSRPVSLTGLPALSVPIGFAQDATPMGMQLVRRAWDETTLFRIGAAYDAAHGWSTRRPGPWPDEIPPAYGSTPPAAPPPPRADAIVTPGWVMDMARLLGYGFVTEEDAPWIAAALEPSKYQLARAQRNLKLELEPSTRPTASV